MMATGFGTGSRSAHKQARGANLLTIRPEVRGDFAGVPVFGVLNVSDLRRLRREQFTAAVDAVFTF